MPPLAVHSVSLIILVALAFDFINGFHDAANSIATVVSTRVLSPRVAVLWAAFFNFVAAFGLGVHVATTIGKGVVDPAAMTNLVVVSALAGAIVWDLITWYYGLPVSSSHALIGGLVGAALAAAGARVLVWSGIQKIVIFIVLSPVVGMLLGFLFMVGDVARAERHPHARGPGLPAAAARLGGTVQPGARHQRRSEDDGRDRRAAVYQRASGAHVLCAALGHPGRARGHRRRHPRRWVADCEDHGDADHQTAAGGRLLRGSGRGDLHPGSVIRRRPRVDHPHDLRGNHGRGRDAAALRGPVGRGDADRVGLDPDHPGVRARGHT